MQLTSILFILSKPETSDYICRSTTHPSRIKGSGIDTIYHTISESNSDRGGVINGVNNIFVFVSMQMLRNV